MVHPDPGLTLPSAVPKADEKEAQEPAGKPAPAVEYLATLAKHQGVVNVVRFCPKGRWLSRSSSNAADWRVRLQVRF